MYPTNYMNPMNNQPMSPDYGYNRMQQVQQMQQAINPTVPNMFGQMNQMNNMNQQQQTPYISAIPVTCLDEAKFVAVEYIRLSLVMILIISLYYAAYLIQYIHHL